MELNHLEGLEHLENRFLLENFFQAKKKFIMNLTKNRRVVYQVFEDVLKQSGCRNPYKQEDFLAHPSFLGRDYKVGGIFVVNFPKPENENLYYRIIMIYDKNFSKLKYYAVGDGYSLDSKEKVFVIYSIDKNYLRIAHRRTEFEDEDSQIKECLELWKDS